MVLLLLLLMPLCGVLSDMTKQMLLAVYGGSIMFHVNIPSNIEINSVFWSREVTVTGQKSMVAIVKPDLFKVISPRFFNRVRSQQPSFSLKLSNLNEEDNGMYEAQIYTNGSTLHRFFQLQVNAESRSPEVQWNILLIISLGAVAVFFNSMT